MQRIMRHAKLHRATDVDGYQPKIIFMDCKSHITGLKQ